jgi:hypothetical protein
MFWTADSVWIGVVFLVSSAYCLSQVRCQQQKESESVTNSNNNRQSSAKANATETQVNGTKQADLGELQGLNEWFGERRISLQYCCQTKVPNCAYHMQHTLTDVYVYSPPNLTSEHEAV